MSLRPFSLAGGRPWMDPRARPPLVLLVLPLPFPWRSRGSVCRDCLTEFLVASRPTTQEVNMNYEFIAIPDAEVPRAVEPTFQHVVQIYASETNKTVSMWRAIPEDALDFKPHEKTNPIRTILVHQLLSERRFFAQFVGT